MEDIEQDVDDHNHRHHLKFSLITFQPMVLTWLSLMIIIIIITHKLI